MSGSSGNTSAGSKGGRTPRGGNEDITERHGRPGGRHDGDTDASTAARPTQTGQQDSEPSDPDKGDEDR